MILMSCNTFTFSIFSLVLVITTTMGNSFTVHSFAPDMHIVGDKSADAEIILLWNNLTTQIGIRERLSAPEFSRAYALVHISIDHHCCMFLQLQKLHLLHCNIYFQTM